MKHFIRFAKPYALIIIIALILLAAQSLAEIMLPTLLATMINDGVGKQNTELIKNIGILMAGASASALVCAIVSSFLASNTATAISASLRRQIYYKVQSFSPAEIDRFGVASLVTRTTNDVVQIQQFLAFALRFAFFTPLMAISGIVMAIYTGGKLSLVLVVSIPVVIGIIAFNIGRVTGLFRSMQIKRQSEPRFP